MQFDKQHTASFLTKYDPLIFNESLMHYCDFTVLRRTMLSLIAKFIDQFELLSAPQTKFCITYLAKGISFNEHLKE